MLDGNGLIIGHFHMGLSSQRRIKVHNSLSSDHFKRIFSFDCLYFLTESCWLCEEVTLKQLSDQRHI